MSDDIQRLARRLDGLDDEPVTSHPGVLDEIHRGLVGELERLADVVSGASRAASSAGRTA